MNVKGDMKILLVEDNPDDIEFTKRALKKGDIKSPVYFVRDGQEAIDYVFNQGKYSDKSEAPIPNLILLDIGLPRLGGLEVLKKIKEDDVLKKIPVVMFTTSKKEADIIDSYNLGVNSFITKPLEFEKYIDTVKSIEAYWGGTNTSPLLSNSQ